jgi:nicotinamidase-related amidase
MARALVVVDVQKGFDEPGWGPRNNPACDRNVAALIEAWRERGEPIVFVRHDSVEPGSPFTPGGPGNEFKDVLSGEPDLTVVKHVHSAFHGEPGLEAWLREAGLEQIAICGIQTNFCCESTARVGSNLGFDVAFAIDATHTFDLTAPDGGTVTAGELARVTAANLASEFCPVVTTAELLGRSSP